MELHDQVLQGVPFQISPQFAAAGVRHGFTTRLGGVSKGIYDSLNLGMNRGDDPAHVRENYRRVCAALKVDINQMVFSHQVHKDHVRQVTAADLGKGLDREVDYEADGLVSDIPGTVLTVFSADCLLILLADPARRVAAAVHAGWRGTALGIPQRAVEIMVNQYGCRREDILAALGPCISKCCFETGEDVPNAMTAALGAGALPYISGGAEGKFHVDLKGLNTLWLERSGVLREHMDISPDCTLCKPEKYWSHRRSGGERGSLAALVRVP